MVPPVTISDKLRARTRHVVSLRRPLAWGALLWAVVVLVPAALLFPEHGLDRPIVQLMGALPLFAMLAAAASLQPHLLLGIGLAAQVPVLVACPQLLGPRAAGPVQALTIAVVTLLFVASCLDLDVVGGKVGKIQAPGRLRRLLRWPRRRSDQVLVVVGAAWLLLAWQVGEVPAERAEKLRTARIAAATLCWVAVQSLAVAPRGPSIDTPTTLLLRRSVWLGLLTAAWWWLGAAAEDG